MDAEKIIEHIAKFKKQNILVIGDIVADIYLEGEISRISREAPVLVLIEKTERTVPGGAANVINNIATLSGNSYAIGVIGDDRGGEGLISSLQKNGVYTDDIIVSKYIKTLTKSRIIAGGRATVSQQVVRIDRENDLPLSYNVEAELFNSIKKLLPQMDGIVLSDYGSGTISDELKNYLIEYSKTNNLPLIVDSRYSIDKFIGAMYIKQNDAELSASVGKILNTKKDICDAAKLFCKKMDSHGLLITRGEDGMILYMEDGTYYDIPVLDKSEVFDVSGAGDTCVATFITAVASGLEPYKSAVLANFASGIAVRKMGTSTVSDVELISIVQKLKGDIR